MMIVVVSDLHFVDETAGRHNTPVDAFHILFDGLRASVRRRLAEGGRVDSIKIVFLGDIFDLLRTEKWFEVSPDERPWGHDGIKTEAQANIIFDAIIAKNRATFDLLGGRLAGADGFPVEPERVYIPGNHDRLCRLYPSLRRKVRRHLGMGGGEEPFMTTFQDLQHGLFARHGHEFDEFNFEGGSRPSEADYLRVPIGDVITTELVAALPWAVMQHADVKKLNAVDQAHLRTHLEEIENVRPFSATLEYLLDQVRRTRHAKRAIEESVDRLIENFNGLPFVKQWYKQHDRWMSWMDAADKIQAVLFLLKKFRVFSSEKWLPLLEKAKAWFAADALLKAAPREFDRLDERIRYIVCGHTHEPLQTAIRTTPAVEPHSQVYLNAGTWRTRYYRCLEGPGFIGWKNMTYIIFWNKTEKRLDHPSYETWDGTLKTFLP